MFRSITPSHRGGSKVDKIGASTSEKLLSNFEALKGRGVRATANGQTIYAGGPRLLEMLGLTPGDSLAAFSDQAGSKGQAVVYLVSE